MVPGAGGASVTLTNAYKAQPLELTLKIHAPKDAVVDGLEIKIGDQSTIRIDRKLKPDEYVICKNGEWYVADRGRKMTERIAVTGTWQLAPGATPVTIKALHPMPEKATLELAVPIIGNAAELKGK